MYRIRFSSIMERSTLAIGRKTRPYIPKFNRGIDFPALLSRLESFIILLNDAGFSKKLKTA